jgi:hypothetical protein
MPRECGWEDCQINAAENGYFCTNHWNLLPLESRHKLLAYPRRPGPVPEGRNQAIHSALIVLRKKLKPGVYEPDPPAASEVGGGPPA